MASERRIYTTLDGLRGIAALLVVFYHNRLLVGPAWPAHGWLAVDLFFMLSGLVIDRAYRDRLITRMTVGQFMLIRVIRLWPIYALGCLAGLGFLLSLHLWRHDIALSDIVIALPNLFFLPALRPIDVGYLVPLNPPGWSLVFELFANLVYAVSIRRLSTPLVAMVVVLAAYGLAVFAAAGAPLESGAMLGEWIGGLLRVTFAFFAGVLAARLISPGTRREGRSAPLIVLATLAAMLLIPTGAWGQWLTIVGLFPLLVVAGAYFEPRDRQTTRLFRALGRLSYPVYALQYPVGIVVLTLPKLLLGSGVQFAGWAILLGFVGGCVLLERYYDSPIRNWLTGAAMNRHLLPLSQERKADTSVRPL